jgi:hypothetical protein
MKPAFTDLVKPAGMLAVLQPDRQLHCTSKVSFGSKAAVLASVRRRQGSGVPQQADPPERPGRGSLVPISDIEGAQKQQSPTLS